MSGWDVYYSGRFDGTFGYASTYELGYRDCASLAGKDRRSIEISNKVQIEVYKVQARALVIDNITRRPPG